MNFSHKMNDKELLGIKDCGKKTIVCKSCSKDLMTFQITKTNVDLIENNLSPARSEIIIDCGFCCSSSEEIEILGQFYIGSPNDETNLEFLGDNHFVSKPK